MLKQLKKYKQLIIGVIIGGVVFGGLPIKAVIEEYICYKIDYPIYVNNELIESKKTPLFTYGGTTYIPLRLFCETLNIPIEWDGEAKRVDLKSWDSQKENVNNNEVLHDEQKDKTKDDVNVSTVIPTPVSEDENFQTERSTKKIDLNPVLINEELYLTIENVQNYLMDGKKKYLISWNIKTESAILFQIGNSKNSINIKLHYFNENYFINYTEYNEAISYLSES